MFKSQLCPRCNSKNPQSNLFCGQCGVSLVGENLSPRYQSQIKTDSKRIISIVLVVCAMFAALFFINQQRLIANGAARQVKRFMEADIKGKMQDESEFVSHRYGELPLNLYQKLRSIMKQSPFTGYDITNTFENDEDATVDVVIKDFWKSVGGEQASKSQKETRYTMQFHLVKEGSFWKIEPVSTINSLVTDMSKFVKPQ